MKRLAEHGNGIALLHARLETEWFRKAWEADALLFLSRRLHFHRQDGSRHEANSGAPVVLVAYGPDNVAALASGAVPGHLVTEWRDVKSGCQHDMRQA